MTEREGPPTEDGPAADLRAQIEATRAHLAATAEALAARMAETPARPEPEVLPREQAPARQANLPVLYRPAEARRSATVAGAVVGVVVLALRLRRRLRR